MSHLVLTKRLVKCCQKLSCHDFSFWVLSKFEFWVVTIWVFFFFLSLLEFFGEKSVLVKTVLWWKLFGWKKMLNFFCKKSFWWKLLFENFFVFCFFVQNFFVNFFCVKKKVLGYYCHYCHNCHYCHYCHYRHYYHIGNFSPNITDGRTNKQTIRRLERLWAAKCSLKRLSKNCIMSNILESISLCQFYSCNHNKLLKKELNIIAYFLGSVIHRWYRHKYDRDVVNF